MSQRGVYMPEKDPLVQEIDAHIEQNNLDPLERLTLRVLKHNYILGKETQEVTKHPSLGWRFRNETGAVIMEWLGILGASYFLFRVIEIMTGLDGLLKLLSP